MVETCGCGWERGGVGMHMDAIRSQRRMPCPRPLERPALYALLYTPCSIRPALYALLYTPCSIHCWRNAPMRHVVDACVPSLKPHTMTLILHVNRITVVKCCILGLVFFRKINIVTTSSGLKTPENQLLRRRGGSGSNERQLDVLKTAQRMTVRVAHMATADRTALPSLPQQFDAALLAQFYRSMYAAHHA